MGVLSRILGRGGTVNDFFGVGVGSFYTADNVGGQGLSFLFRQGTPAITGAFGSSYLYHVISFRPVFITRLTLSLAYHNVTFFEIGYHETIGYVNSAICTKS